MALSYEQILEALMNRPKVSKWEIEMGEFKGFLRANGIGIKRGVTTGVKLTGYSENDLIFKETPAKQDDIFGYGAYWLFDDPDNQKGNITMSVSADGEFMLFPPKHERYGFLPALPRDLIEGICTSLDCNNLYQPKILPVNEIGDIASNQDELTNLLANDKLTIVDYYPINKSGGLKEEGTLEVEKVPIYQTNEGKKYIRLKNYSMKFKTRNGQEVASGEEVWVNIIHPKIYCFNNLAIYANLPIMGLTFSDLDEYLNKHWYPRLAKQIEKALKEKEELDQIVSQVQEENQTPADLVTICYQCNLPGMLYGPAGVGKHQILKQTPANYTNICVNSLTKEYILQGEWVDELRGDYRDQILHFEITNTTPIELQEIVANIIKTRTVQGKEIPDYVRIFITTTDENKLIPALQDQCFPIKINPTDRMYFLSWSRWAIENKINPALIAYILHNIASENKNLLYNEEFDLTPKKWELASYMLNESKNIDVLKSLINGYKLKSLQLFCEAANYNVKTTPSVEFNDPSSMSAEKKYLYVVCLASCKDEEIVTNRKSVESLNDSDLLDLFEMLVSTTKERINIIVRAGGHTRVREFI